jgi:hypothetical protein
MVVKRLCREREKHSPIIVEGTALTRLIGNSYLTDSVRSAGTLMQVTNGMT